MVANVVIQIWNARFPGIVFPGAGFVCCRVTCPIATIENLCLFCHSYFFATPKKNHKKGDLKTITARFREGSLIEQ